MGFSHGTVVADDITPLDGFDAFAYRADAISHTVYVAGQGPGVLLMHELPGMVPECVALARHIVDHGFTVFMPLLFGKADAPPSTSSNLARVCISREFNCFAHHESSPVTRWLRALCVERIRPRCPGSGIGAIGMCFTGGFVLSLFIDDLMLAPVICQPGLPFPSLKPGAKKALGVSPGDLAEAKNSRSPILGLRFDGDTKCPRERFDTLSEMFGSRFERHDLPGKDHSVLTLSFVDTPGHPTFAARERLIAFLTDRLARDTGAPPAD